VERFIDLDPVVAWANTFENVPDASSPRKTPNMTINRPIKTRRLKNADCEVDFFFIDGV
jgi:hypothetical protein